MVRHHNYMHFRLEPGPSLATTYSIRSGGWSTIATNRIKAGTFLMIFQKLYLRLPLEFQCYSGLTEYQMMKERLPLATALRCFSIHSQAVKPDGSIIMLQFGTSVLDSSSQLLAIEISLHLLCFKSAL